MTLEQAYTILGLQDPLKETGLLVDGQLRCSGATTITAIEMALDYLENPNVTFRVLYRHTESTRNLTDLCDDILIKLGNPNSLRNLSKKQLRRESLNGFNNGFAYCDHFDLSSKYGASPHQGRKRLARKFFNLDDDMVRVLNRDDIHLYDCTRDEIMEDTMLHTCCLDDLSQGFRIWGPGAEWKL